MSRNSLRLLALIALVGATAACGGRKRLADDSTMAWREVMEAQRQARPAQKLAYLDADDAKIIVENHRATYSRGGGGTKGNDFGASLSSGGGILTPVSTILGTITGGEPAYGNDPVASDR